jgi:colanic acid biosynthesis glycosyl transferase WcaI
VKILFLNQAFYPDVAATAQHLSDLAGALSERGHEVTVVCSDKPYDNPAERYPRREQWRGVDIRRIPSTSFGKTARWRRAADFASFFVRCVIQLAMLPRYDLVVAMTSPPLISWLGAIFAFFRADRFAFWVMDLNPDEALAAGWLRKDSCATKLLSAMLRHSLHRADSVIVLDRFMAERIAAKGINADKISVLPPWSHDHIVRYDLEGREKFRKDNGLDGKYVVMYSGNHSPCHPLDTLLEAVRRLAGRQDIAFCFAGGGSEFATVRRFAAEHKLKNVVMLPYQPLNRLAASLSSADLHAVVMGDPFVGLVHPCKVYNIRTLGIPYLYIGPAESHVGDLGPAFAARHGEVDKVVAHVISGARSRSMRVRPAADSKGHSQDQLVSRMVSTLERVPAPAAQPAAVPAYRSRQVAQSVLSLER